MLLWMTWSESLGFCLLVVLALLSVGVLCVYRWAPAWLLDAAMALASWNAGLRKISITIGATQWVYLDSGDSGIPIVLVHGYAANKESWLQVANELKGRGFRLLIPDLPGFGESPPAADGDYAAGAQAERLREFIQAVLVEPFHLAGHSMGGYVAGAYVANYPQDLLGVYLVAPAGVQGSMPPLLRLKAEVEGGNPLFVDSVESFKHTMALAMVKPPRVPRRLVQVMVARELPHRALRQMQTSFWFSDPLEHMLHGCRVPLRLCWGEEDQVLPIAGAALLQAAMPAASLKQLPGVGHMPLVEAPKMLTQDYLGFIEQNVADTHGVVGC